MALFLESHGKSKRIFDATDYFVYGKIKLHARSKITTTKPHGGGGGLEEN